MKITIESTDSLVELDLHGARMPARVWQGATEGGVPVICFVARISPQTHDVKAAALFQRELKEQATPTVEPFTRAIDLRLIL